MPTEWEPCTPLGKHPDLNDDTTIRRGVLYELVAHLLARGATHAEVAHILEPGKQRSPEAASMWLGKHILNQNSACTRARAKHVSAKLGVPADLATGTEFGRKDLIAVLIERLRVCRDDRVLSQLAAVLARIAGWETPTVSVTATVSPVDALTAVIQARMAQIPPKPAIPAEVVSAQDVIEQNAQSKTVI